MSLTPGAKGRRDRLITDVLDLLSMANRAVHRARAELDGDAFNMATAIAAQLDVLREKAEQLARETKNASPANAPAIFLAETMTL